jgi:hypothetical protein
MQSDYDRANAAGYGRLESTKSLKTLTLWPRRLPAVVARCLVARWLPAI